MDTKKDGGNNSEKVGEELKGCGCASNVTPKNNDQPHVQQQPDVEDEKELAAEGVNVEE